MSTSASWSKGLDFHKQSSYMIAAFGSQVLKLGPFRAKRLAAFTVVKKAFDFTRGNMRRHGVMIPSALTGLWGVGACYRKRCDMIFFRIEIFHKLKSAPIRRGLSSESLKSVSSGAFYGAASAICMWESSGEGWEPTKRRSLHSRAGGICPLGRDWQHRTSPSDPSCRGVQ